MKMLEFGSSFERELPYGPCLEPINLGTPVALFRRHSFLARVIMEA
jgi:hypothetical protein